MKKQGLWTKDFTLISVSATLSAIGGTAMNLPVSLTVFAQTNSTLKAAFIMVCSQLPGILLPIFIAPVIDKSAKKKWIVGLDALMALVFIGMGFYILHNVFVYGVYIAFTLVEATVSVFYQLAFQAWYPDLIPIGYEQKGYSVDGMIYPLVTIVMAPVATLLYQIMSLGNIFFITAALTAVAVILEVLITEKRCEKIEAVAFSRYLQDIKEGFSYLKQEKGIRYIYTYMSITNGAYSGIVVITQAFYQTQPWLSATMLGFLRSVETIGRVLGSMIQYKKEIPPKHRYGFTKFVYFVNESINAILLFLPYPLMLLGRFVCGSLGSQSATIRQAAVQSYLPPEMRARVNGLFGVLFASGNILFYLLAGFLGQIMPYRIVTLILGLTTLTSQFILIWLPKDDNARVYNAVRQMPGETGAEAPA